MSALVGTTGMGRRAYTFRLAPFGVLMLAGILLIGQPATAQVPVALPHSQPAFGHAVAGTTPAATPTCPPEWEVVPGPSVAGDQTELSDVAAVSANDIWTVGYTYVHTSFPQTLIE